MGEEDKKEEKHAVQLQQDEMGKSLARPKSWMIQEEQRAVVSFRRRLERRGGPFRRYEVAPVRGGRAATSFSSGSVARLWCGWNCM